MNNIKHKRKSSILRASNYSEMGDFWDTHDLSDFWDKTQPVRSNMHLIKSKQASGRNIDMEDVRLLELPDEEKKDKS